MILANDAVTITRCPPGPPPGDDGLDEHQFQGWRGLHGNEFETDENWRMAGDDPLQAGVTNRAWRS
jgi:hypothetical protein